MWSLLVELKPHLKDVYEFNNKLLVHLQQMTKLEMLRLYPS